MIKSLAVSRGCLGGGILAARVAPVQQGRGGGALSGGKVLVEVGALYIEGSRIRQTRAVQGCWEQVGHLSSGLRAKDSYSGT